MCVLFKSLADTQKYNLLYQENARQHTETMRGNKLKKCAYALHNLPKIIKRETLSSFTSQQDGNAEINS